jgi:UDP-GlcNAc:undecaprenyl-phosphate GlcNAc-1-phosphate transferase
VFVVFVTLALLLFGLYLGRVQVYAEDEGPREPDGALVKLIENLPYRRQVATACIDSVLILLAYYTAYRLRFEHAFSENEARFVASAPIVLACQLVAFAAFRVYQGVWRYTSLIDLIRLLKAASVGTALAILALLLVFRFEGYSRAVFVIDWLVLVLLVGGSRLSLRMFEELLRQEALGTKRVLIYGAGDGGVVALREMRNNKEWGRVAVGFVDDSRWKQRTSIHGVPVLGTGEQIDALVETHTIDEVVVASLKIPAERLEWLTAACESRGVRVVRAGLTLVERVAHRA